MTPGQDIELPNGGIYNDPRREFKARLIKRICSHMFAL